MRSIKTPIPKDFDNTKSLLVNERKSPMQQEDAAPKTHSKPKTSNWAGLILLAIVVLLLACIAIPNFVKARERPSHNPIVNNLRIIAAAKAQWALANKKPVGTAVTDITVISGYLKNGTVISVLGETYYPNAIGTPTSAILPVRFGTYAAGSTMVGY